MNINCKFDLSVSSYNVHVGNYVATCHVQKMCHIFAMGNICKCL